MEVLVEYEIIFDKPIQNEKRRCDFRKKRVP
jgi:hypothetical protein